MSARYAAGGLMAWLGLATQRRGPRRATAALDAGRCVSGSQPIMQAEGYEEAMNAGTGPLALFIAGLWWALAAALVVVGWRRRNRVLLIVGALLFAVEIWNTVVSL